MSDPAKYRTRDEVSKMREEHDPIDGLRKLMLDKRVAGEDTIKEIDREVKSVINDAAKFAQETPEPDERELWTDVYASA